MNCRHDERPVREVSIAAASSGPLGSTDWLPIDKLMWGSDYPHMEGTWPHTRQTLEDVFGSVPRDEVQQILAATAAEVYGFDVEKLSQLAAEIGPTSEGIGV